MPPHLFIHDFLGADTVAEVAPEYTLEHESAFQPTRVGDSERRQVDPTVRVSAATRDPGPFRVDSQIRNSWLSCPIWSRSCGPIRWTRQGLNYSR